jgi:hypothetical protein
MKNGRHMLFLAPGLPKNEDDFICIPPIQEFLIRFQQAYPVVRISVIPFQYPYHKKYYRWNGVKILPLGGKNSTAQKPLLWLKAVVTANKLQRLKSFDVIHPQWLGECAMIGNIFSRKFNRRHICTLMGQDVKKSNRYLRISRNTSVKIIILSKNQSEKFSDLTNRKVDETIHRGIDDKRFENSGRDIDLLAVGSLIP